jgi:ribonuclease HI
LLRREPTSSSSAALRVDPLLLHRYPAGVVDERHVPTVPSSKAAPASGVAVLWTDGAARGNPGPAGCGAILKSASGEVLDEQSEYLGHTTNNVAEYRALLLGLTRALACGVRELEVRADSELLIKQLRGEYRVRSVGLQPLHAQAKQLISRFVSVRLVHVRRELNVEADRLANRGIDAQRTPTK